MPAIPKEEPDSLTDLEERILRAVSLVQQLRQERDGAEKQLRQALEEKSQIADELQVLRSERSQVRGRIEKLLGQLDSLTS